MNPRCPITEAEALHDRKQTALDKQRELRVAEAELMADTFRERAVQSLDEDILADLLSEHPHAVSRLALFTIQRNLLELDYTDNQMALDVSLIKMTLIEWIETAAQEFKTSYIEDDK